ncbi:hypothetical protein [Streptomyces monomycini]|uniref:hypothetical protein n=1 Tax=Streptomyces monomycini TaxID=371720 RepID=UPI0012FEFDB1|nr:hypothetical protein [Streptomyces monomycini]
MGLRRGARAVENVVVAKQMRRFFKALPAAERRDPKRVAQAYGRHLFHERRRTLVDEKRFADCRFHVGIGVGPTGFERLTQRAVLVSDTLLLSHHGQGPRHLIQTLDSRGSLSSADFPYDDGGPGYQEPPGEYTGGTVDTETLHMRCPDLDYLGRWLLKAEPLLRAGSAWYLPSYSVARSTEYYYPDGTVSAPAAGHARVPSLLDFMQDGRRVIAQSDAPAVLCRVVRPVVENLELPYLAGVPLDVFSTITAQEFGSYRLHRTWLRGELDGLDAALNATESEHELTRIGERIREGMYGMNARVRKVRRTRAVAASGAAFLTVGASLLAVHGPSLLQAVSAVLGGAASSGLWVALQTVATRGDLRDDPWYYVWALSEAQRGL